MKKTVSLFAALMLSAVLVSGCGVSENNNSAENSTDNSKSSVEVVDCSGRNVEVPADIDKIVCTSPSAVAFLVAMGEEENIVGAHGSTLGHSWAPVFYDGFREEAGKVTLFGKNPNAEELIKADVDLVILKDADYAEELRKSGINAVCFKYNNKDELFYAVDMLGTIFGDAAKKYADKWEKHLDDTVAEIAEDISKVPADKKCNVYYADATGAEATNETLYNTQGKGSFVEYWINTIGASLVTSEYEGLETIEQETALSLNPDTIFTCGWLEYQYKDLFMSDPLWQDVPAVKNDRVFLMPTSLASYDRFTVELPLMLDYSANLLYPEYHKFGGTEEMREFYKEYYNKEFTDEQLENMYKGLNPDGTKMGE